MEAFAARKFGPGGPYHRDTPGAWSDSPGVRGSAQVHSPGFKACVSLQAHHLDLEFYDRFFRQGAYLPSHAGHMAAWHGR